MNLRQVLVFLVGLSMPFNNLAVNIFGRNVSAGLFASAFYFIAMIPYLKKVFVVGRYHGHFIWNIFIYCVLLTIVNIANSAGYNTPVFSSSLLMCYLLFLLLLVHSMLDCKALSICLYGVGFGGILMSFFHFLGIGVSFNTDLRLVMFGENSNELGIYMALSSIVILNDFILNDDLNLGKKRFCFILFFIPIILLLFATGSRTAFAIFILSVFVIILFYPLKSLFTKFVFIALGFGVLVYVFCQLESTDAIIIQRLMATVEDGNVSGRDQISESLLPYICESPIWGYGQTGYVDISKKALSKFSLISGIAYGFSPHNVILEVLLYTGCLGLGLWLLFWFKILWRSWLMFYRERVVMSILLCIPILACILSGQLLTSKWAYILYAYILSESLYFKTRIK